MFEKEAEERVKDYIIEKWDCLMKPCKTLEDCRIKALEFDDAVNLVKDGAEFGYNKANEWHYPSKGELPGESEEEIKEKGEKVYAIFKNNSYYIVDRVAVKNYEDLIAWTELPTFKRTYLPLHPQPVT